VHRYDLAEQHANKAISLDGNSPEGHRVLAYLAQAHHDLARAAAQAEEAIDRGSKDFELFVLLGDSYADGANVTTPDAARARVDMYENAINLSPRRLEVYERLNQALFAIDKPREEDAKFLNIGVSLFPGEDWMRVGTAVVDARLGRGDVAMTTIEGVLRPESTLDPSQRSYVANLRRSWLTERMNAEVRTAADKSDFAGAHAVLSRYREQIGENSDYASYLEKLENSLQVQELMSKYTAARNANRDAEARTLAGKLLALPDLPANLRSFLEKQPSRAR
jgi:hypothetical protein